MSFDDWILALHLLSAFAYVAGMVVFWVLIYAVRKTDTPEGTIRMAPVVRVGHDRDRSGGGGNDRLRPLARVLGRRIRIWDFWIIAALVLWAIAGGLGGRTGKAYMEGMTKAQGARSRRTDRPERRAARAESDADRVAAAHAASSIAILLLLIDMIWKPGA